MLFESTPHSGGYVASSLSYWENGAPKQLTVPGLPLITYGVDGEGRTSTVTANSGMSPVTNCCGYSPAGVPSTVTYGSGDSDNFAYDPLTNRITQYQLGMGSNYVKGDLTWNSNGTLARQTITDTVNSTNTQTCNYNYDDLGRLGKADCGTAWGQTFNYDAFGNITKNVISGSTGVSLQPTYASSTNRMSALPGATPTYNAFGALTSDGTRAYSWDAVGNMLAADSTVVIYDALDRAAEIQKAGIYTQVVYSPIGKVALFNSGNLATAFVPLPAGGQAIYTAAGLQRIRHTDYLGSSRLTTNTTVPTAVYSEASYAPFGEPYKESGTRDRSFTGQTQDAADGLYDFLFRRYDPTQGRWISPDPLGLGAVNPAIPQSWNRYAYVLNNPLTFTDPFGLYCFYGGPGDTPQNDSNPDDYDWDSDGPEECAATGGRWYDNPTTTVTVNGDDGSVSWDITGLNGFFDPFSYFDEYWDALRELRNAPVTAKDYATAIADSFNNNFPTVCSWTTSLSGSVLGYSVRVSDTQSGFSAGWGVTGAPSDKVRVSVGLSANGSSIEPSASIRVGSPSAGLAVSPLNGQIGGYIGREFTIFGRQTGVNLQHTIGRIGTNSTCPR